MSDEKTSPTPAPDLFAAASLASPFHMRESNERKTTPATSGRKCLDLSGNAGPLGLLEKTLLGSSNWAWTKYSLTWRAKATPQGRLIFQLARLAPRTSDSDSGLLHTPTAKANQMAPSMVTNGKGNWVSTLWPTPKTPTGGSSISHVAEWRGNTPYNEKGQKIQLDTHAAVRMEEGMWPTPRTTGLDGGSNSRQAAKARGMFPTPDVGAAKGRGQKSATERHRLGGSLNPKWVAWLMGYPIEYFSYVPWETRSSRKSRKK